MIRSAESVSPKHPDKVCDQISDAVLDACLEQDPMSRVAIESLGGHNHLVVMGEVTTHADVDFGKVARRFIGEHFELTTNIAIQSPEIGRGVDAGGAGDQGVMVGYATSETESLIPKETFLARDLNKLLFEKYPYDGKTQITLHEGKIEAVVASFQNAPAEELKKEVEKWLSSQDAIDSPKVHANPAGDWEIGSFDADTGLTGRKLAVDNYGPHIPLGGGCFSGKDATKVDRSAAYMARKIAVDYLKKKGAKEAYVYLAYAIGVAEPVHAEVILDGKTEEIKGYDLTPKGIIEFLDLRKPQFEATARYGHFGNNFKWDS